MKNISGIKVTDGFYLTDDISQSSSYSKTELLDLFINGSKPKKTFDNNWVFVEEEPKRIHKILAGKIINKRYELKDPAMASEKIPLTLSFDEAQYKVDTYESEWREEYKDYQSLYKYLSDTGPETEEDIEFDFTLLAELNEIEDHGDFAYSIFATQYESEGTREITKKSKVNQIIDRIVFPGIILDSKPCMLSSKDTYDIVRYHIKQHINSEYAEITSDYNFCFTVLKKIQLKNPYDEKIEILNHRGKSYRSPKYRTRNIAHTKTPIFEMTYSPENYKGYTPIQPFKGEDVTDLKNRIDRYLEELMERINLPLKECSQCGGLGFTDLENMGVNDEK